MNDLIPAHIKVLFEAWTKTPDGVADDAVAELGRVILTQLRQMPKQANSGRYGVIATQLFSQHFGQTPLALQLEIQRCVMSRLALGLPDILQGERLTEGIFSYYPSEFERLATCLETAQEHEKLTPLSQFTRFLTGLTVPCGAQNLDLRSAIPLPSAIMAVCRMRSISPLLKYFNAGGLGLWYRPHTDINCLGEYDADGFNRYYRRVAELLRLHPNVKGLVGTSWFYDPVVPKISPRLAFLPQQQIEMGAFCFKHGSGTFEIENATKTSPTRRKLYEEGRYLPTSYSWILPRDRLIKWSEVSG